MPIMIPNSVLLLRAKSITTKAENTNLEKLIKGSMVWRELLRLVQEL